MAIDIDDPADGGPKPKPRAPSPYAKAPYAVGKGKAPVAHQFKKGGKGGPGRPKGSRTRSPYDKLLDERVKVGEDRLGRPVYKSWREVIDRQLIKKAASGDVVAIRLVKEFEFKMMELERRYGPPPLTPDEMRKKVKEDEKQKADAEKLSAMLAQALTMLATLKKVGLADVEEGEWKLNLKALEFVERMPRDPVAGRNGPAD